MNRKRNYVHPAIEVVHSALDIQLMQTSFPNNGGHKKSDDDGQDINDAKQGFFYEDDEENSSYLWKL